MGLIEVLVALVVVSVGVLGIAGMQLTGMQHGGGSLDRSKALMFAEDMAERMRVNAGREGPVSAAYDGFDSDTDADCGVAPVPYCDAPDAGAATDCGRDALARADLKAVACGAWAGGKAGDGVVDALPGGRLTIDCVGGSGPCPGDGTWSVAVNWAEGSTTSTDVADPDAKAVVMRLRP